jgi:SAM-dependent methyltransferase
MSASYVLGASAGERQRLVQQAGYLQGVTEQVLRSAGIAPGFRVLDLGCGAGDVSFVAAHLAGASGSILGVDRDGLVLQLAKERAEQAGLSQVNFVEETVERFEPHEPFDAVIGRLVLIHQANPTALLARAAQWLKPGGVLAFIETDMSAGLRAVPEIPLFSQVGEWITGAFRRGGTHLDLGGHLYSTFLAAGLPGPTMRLFQVVGGGPQLRGLYQHYADTVRSLLPKIEAYGLATARDIGIDSLAERLENEIHAARAQVTSFPMIAAWTRVT